MSKRTTRIILLNVLVGMAGLLTAHAAADNTNATLRIVGQLTKIDYHSLTIVTTGGVATVIHYTGATMIERETDHNTPLHYTDLQVGQQVRAYYSNNDKAVFGVIITSPAGTVPDEARTTLSQVATTDLPGVVRVDNQLVGSSASSNVSPDVLLAGKIDLALRLHRNANATRPTLQVKDGVVTLQGEASGRADRQMIAEYVADVPGVKEIRNEMTVASLLEPVAQTSNNQTLEDAALTAKIVTVLMTNRSTSSVITRVSSRNGEVTLTGSTRNEAQNALIVKLVTDVPGVTSVKNQMTIENEPRSN